MLLTPHLVFPFSFVPPPKKEKKNPFLVSRFWCVSMHPHSPKHTHRAANLDRGDLTERSGENTDSKRHLRGSGGEERACHSRDEVRTGPGFQQRQGDSGVSSHLWCSCEWPLHTCIHRIHSTHPLERHGMCTKCPVLSLSLCVCVCVLESLCVQGHPMW